MNATAIATHLNVTESAIIEIQEWARVLWVRIRGLGARFVSKKVGNMLSRSEAAKQIAAAIEGYDREDYQCSVWEKGGRCRIYVKDMGYSNASAQDRGFVHINTDGSIGFDNLKSSRGVKKIVEGLNLAIAEDKEGAEAMAQPHTSNRYLSGNAAWNAYHADHPAGYNRSTGEWDSPLDRDDYEG